MNREIDLQRNVKIIKVRNDQNKFIFFFSQIGILFDCIEKIFAILLKKSPKRCFVFDFRPFIVI